MSGTVPTNRHCETKPGRDTAKNAGNCGLRVPHDLAPYMHTQGNLAALRVWIKMQSAEGVMLSHCANLQCLKPFLRLGEGKLFLVETSYVAGSGGTTLSLSPRMRQPPRRLERHWLCDECATLWTLVQDRQKGIALLPLQLSASSNVAYRKPA
jgi:hypothetical protein